MQDNTDTGERDITLTFYNTCYAVRTTGNGHHLGMIDILAKLYEVHAEMSSVSLLEDVQYPEDEVQLDGGFFEVENVNHLFVKDHWKEEIECLFDKTEFLVRDMMYTRKSDKARSSAPSAWTGYVGFGSNQKDYKGFCVSAPYTKSLGFSSARLSTSLEKNIFHTVQLILRIHFPTFAIIFERAGRIDLKYNSCISESDKHFDKLDKCHQVIFTLGLSQECLMIQEGEIGVLPTKVQCFRNPKAFDGRFQHWVEQCGASSPLDRIAIVCYLVDVPESYKHAKMNMAAIIKHISPDA